MLARHGMRRCSRMRWRSCARAARVSSRPRWSANQAILESRMSYPWLGPSSVMPVWDAYLSERDRRIFGSAGYGARAGFGKRPVVLVIDVNYNFVGDRPEPIEESVKRWRNSCGLEGWAAVAAIARLLDGARAQRIPVIYSTGM